MRYNLLIIGEEDIKKQLYPFYEYNSEKQNNKDDWNPDTKYDYYSEYSQSIKVDDEIHHLGCFPILCEEKYTTKWVSIARKKDILWGLIEYFCTYAILKDGEWIENSPSNPRWIEEYYDKFIKDLPPDTLLTCLNMHS